MYPLLEAKNVCLSYHTPSGETAALSDLSFQVAPGEFLAIVGPSGCGKSTLLDLLCGLLTPESGSIRFPNGSATIGYMLQKDHLLEWRTIYQNVILGLQIRRCLTPAKKAAVEQMLVNYGLERFRNSRPSQLSGGMRQRAALIRTLALEPNLLLLDEPFSALDYQTRLNVSDDIGKILRKEAKTAILVTHDIAEAVSMADRVLVLTKRPASVRCMVPIHLTPAPRSPLDARNASNFKNYFNQIWRELNDDTAIEAAGAVSEASKAE